MYIYFEKYLSRLVTKTNKMACASSETQISLDIRPVWSESSLTAWRKLGSLATHWAPSKDWLDWADAQADLRIRWAQMPFCWFCHAAAHLLQIAFARRKKDVTDKQLLHFTRCYELTNYYLGFNSWSTSIKTVSLIPDSGIDKACRPRSDAAEPGIWLGSV